MKRICLVFFLPLMLCAKTTVFERSGDWGYRIPALVTAQDGTLLAFAERRVGLHDHAKNDIVLRRSVDGTAWEAEQVLVDEGGDSLNDPCAVVLDTGRVLLMYQRFPEGVHARKSARTEMAPLGYGGPKHTRSYVMHSDDHGQRWSRPREITRQARRPEYLSIGSPGRGIQLASGRILFPLYQTRPLGDNKRDWMNSVIYSDDGGMVWHRGGEVPNPEGGGFGNEAQIVALANGDVLMSSRFQGGAPARLISVSKDGGLSWSPFRVERQLTTPACMSSVIRVGDRLIHSLPHSRKGRENGTIFTSADDGKSWESLEVLDPKGFAYSCLSLMPDGRVACLYETDGYKRIVFKAFDPVPRPKPNVLFIAVDDWNDWVGCLGHSQAITPNLDRLAKRGVLFANAHCPAPVCNPSRAATMTGLNPDTTGVQENRDVMRKKMPEVVTLPQHFAAHGYTTHGGGKIYHDVPPFHDPESFDEYFWWHPNGAKGNANGRVSPYSNQPDPEPEGRPTRAITPLTKRNFDWAGLDEPEENWPDVKVAAWADEFLAAEHDQPFFLALGIFRPHVPWFNPRKYVEQYPLDSIQLPPVLATDLDDLSPWARARAMDRNSKHLDLVAAGEWPSAVQAYLASISFADASLGRVLDSLDRSPHKDNTIIVFWSDHGYHLGEKGHWHKRTLWHRSTHVPMVIFVPGQSPGVSSRPVNLLDLYPTLSALCRLPIRKELEGRNLVPLLENPVAEWPYYSKTTYVGNYALSGERFRYIHYKDGAEELYDRQADPHEWHNLADDQNFSPVLEGFRRALAEQD